MTGKRLANVCRINARRFAVEAATSANENEFWVILSGHGCHTASDGSNGFEDISHVAFVLLLNVPDYLKIKYSTLNWSAKKSDMRGVAFEGGRAGLDTRCTAPYSALPSCLTQPTLPAVLLLPLKTSSFFATRARFKRREAVVPVGRVADEESG
jgi:hypothetical protein